MFKNIELSNGKYSIDEYGTVKRNETNKILKDHVNNKGYRYIDLRIDGKTKKFLVHRLVALTFLPKVGGCDIINHKDCNPLNCHVDNLEWCTYSWNNKYGYIKGNKPLTEAQLNVRKKRKTYLHKKINQYNLNGELLNTFECITDASKAVGYSVCSISACAHGRLKTCGGYIWKFKQSQECND